MPRIVTFGEAMVRLTPPNHGRLSRARSFDVEVGGAELNTAAGLAALGHSPCWISELPDSPLGRLIEARAQEAGVFVAAAFSPVGRCGLYFLEEGASPRASEVVYDRTGSSFTHTSGPPRGWDEWLRVADWFHTTGITPALGPGPAKATADALKAARAAEVPTSIDLNYRSKLWSREDAGRVMAGLLPLCDVLFASEPDAEQLFGITGADFPEVAQKLAGRFGVSKVVGTRREAPLAWRNRFAAVGWSGAGVEETPWHDVEIVDRLGAGDAMAAGVIHGLLTGGDFGFALRFGAALGALQHTAPGDLVNFRPDEVEAVMAGQGVGIRR